MLSKFQRENPLYLREKLRIGRVGGAMNAHNIELARAKKLCQRSFKGRDLISEPSVKFHCFLLGEKWAEGQELEFTL